jgi:hypothetical protein
MMSGPNGRYTDQVSDATLASVFMNPENAGLKAAFEKAAKCEIAVSTFGSTIVFGTDVEANVPMIKTALGLLSEQLTVPDDRLKEVLSNFNFG